MVANSKLDPRNATGKSAGMFGDAFKLGGKRVDVSLQKDLYLPNGNVNPVFEGSFGGFQGGPGKIFGFKYAAGSLPDHLVEAYAGPHDWLGKIWAYNAQGNNDYANSAFGQIVGGKVAHVVADVMTGINIGLATPLAVASLIGVSAPTHATLLNIH